MGGRGGEEEREEGGDGSERSVKVRGERIWWRERRGKGAGGGGGRAGRGGRRGGEEGERGGRIPEVPIGHSIIREQNERGIIYLLNKY